MITVKYSHSRRMYNAQKKTRADLATPLDDPRVKALVEALEGTTTALDEITSDDWLGDIDDKKVRKTLHQARAALSALEENR